MSRLQRFLARPAVYEAIQVATGARITERRLRDILGPLVSSTPVLDAGGGTGIIGRLFDGGYYCLDWDAARARVAAKRGRAIVGDVTHLPIRSSTVGLVVLRAITHHLSDEACAALFTESRRVLRSDGYLILLDALWAPRWWPGRVLWRLDQGDFPRTLTHLRALVQTNFVAERTVCYTMLHRYYLMVAHPSTA